MDTNTIGLVISLNLFINTTLIAYIFVRDYMWSTIISKGVGEALFQWLNKLEKINEFKKD